MKTVEKNPTKIKTFFDSDLEMFEELDRAEEEIKSLSKEDFMTLEESYAEINGYMNTKLESKKISYV